MPISLSKRTSYYDKVVVQFVVASLTYRLNSQVVNCVSMEIMAVTIETNSIPLMLIELPWKYLQLAVSISTNLNLTSSLA